MKNFILFFLLFFFIQKNLSSQTLYDFPSILDYRDCNCENWDANKDFNICYIHINKGQKFVYHQPFLLYTIDVLNKDSTKKTVYVTVEKEEYAVEINVVYNVTYLYDEQKLKEYLKVDGIHQIISTTKPIIIKFLTKKTPQA